MQTCNHVAIRVADNCKRMVKVKLPEEDAMNSSASKKNEGCNLLERDIPIYDFISGNGQIKTQIQAQTQAQVVRKATQKFVSLKLNKEFKRAYYQGKFKAHPFLITYMVKNRKKRVRVGITASKKTGCAVKRNRARRIIKQAFFELLREGEVPKGYNDYVFVARMDTAGKKTQDIKKVMKKQFYQLTVTADKKKSQ